MTVKIKLIQPTGIKDKKMVREIIEHIRKPIPAAVYRRNRKLADLVRKMTKNPVSNTEKA